MTERRVHISLATDAAAGGALRPDGTLWSHAVSPGTYIRDGSFTIGDAELSSFVTNFNKGYPSKVPVDYEHGTTNGATAMGVAVPKAGDVLEMHAVLTEGDITPDIQASIDHSRAKQKALGVNKPVDPLGLWVRWVPTPKALKMVKDGEYTEMSIAFSMEFADNKGNIQGPTIKAIALCNRPFVQDMVSIAATATDTEHRPMELSKYFPTFSALIGKPVTTDAEATTALTSLSESKATTERELAAANSFRDVIAAEFAGEKDATKLVTAIRNLNTSVTKLTGERDEAVGKQLGAEVELHLRKYEKKLTAPAKDLYAKQLTANIKAGQKIGETDTDKVLASLPDIPGLEGQSTGADTGKGLTDDAAIQARVTELTEKDPRISKMRDPNSRALAAVSQARQEFAAKQTK